MYEKILAAIRTKYSNLGLSNETLEGIAKQLAGFVKEETEIDAAVTGAEATLKAIQSFGDKRATSEAERLKKEYEGKKNEPKSGEKLDETPEWAKGLVSTIDVLKNEITTLKTEKTSQTLSEKLNSILAEKKVPESFVKTAVFGRTFKDENEVNTLAEMVVNQFESFKQESVNLGFSYTEPPKAGEAPKKDSDEIAQMINDGTKKIVEQTNN